MKNSWTHFDDHGHAIMVDVSDKDETARTAIARGVVDMSKEAFDAVAAGRVGKGDVLGVARIAGITAAKKTWDLIPMCHPIMLTACSVEFEMQKQSIYIEATAKTSGVTGVEMEALTAVSAAALTIYDMCKAIDKRMVIHSIHLAEKSGGRSGAFKHER